MNAFTTRARTWIDDQSALHRIEIARAPKGVPTYVGVVVVSAVVACASLHIAVGILVLVPAWMLIANLLRIHSDAIEDRAGGNDTGAEWVREGLSYRLRDRLPRWLTRRPAAATLIALLIGLLWVLVFFGNDISTKAQSYSSLALTAASYQDTVTLTEPNVFGFVTAQPCYYVEFSRMSWLFRVTPSDELCYSVASFFDPTLMPRAVLLVACTYLVVPAWWLVVFKGASNTPHLRSEETN